MIRREQIAVSVENVHHATEGWTKGAPRHIELAIFIVDTEYMVTR